MKTYKNLWDDFISDGNIDRAMDEAFKGGRKKRRRDVAKALANRAAFRAKVREAVFEQRVFRHTPKVIHDGVSRKRRVIIVPSIVEQVIHHMLCNVLVPILYPRMHGHSYASLPGRGATEGKRHIEKFLRGAGRGAKYFLKIDVRKFFESIRPDRVMMKVSRYVKDERVLGALGAVLAVAPYPPIGFYTSQWLANFYLNDFDFWCAERCSGYFRYMDDIVAFGPNKRKLHALRRDMEAFLAEEGLSMRGNWRVALFDWNGKGGALDFMGFKFMRNRTVLRKGIVRKARRKALAIHAKGPSATSHDARQMLSYLGWFRRTATYGYWNRMIAPLVSVRGLRRMVSAADRRRRECGRTLNA